MADDVRIALAKHCSLAPMVKVGTLGWLRVTDELNIVAFDGTDNPIASKRGVDGQYQITNYIKLAK